MKTRKKILIKEARLLWQKLLNEGWQKTNKKWGANSIKKNFFISENNRTFRV